MNTAQIDPDTLEFQSAVKCYDGCFDSKSQAVINRQEQALGIIKRFEPEAHVTFFHLEEEYAVHVYGRELGSRMKTRGAAIADAYNKLVAP